MGDRLEVHENGVLVFDQLMEQAEGLNDVIYVPCLNSYLILTQFSLYRKDSNDKPPSLFMSFDFPLVYVRGMDAQLQYSSLNKRLIVSKIFEKTLSVVNPKKKKDRDQLKAEVWGGDQ